MADRHRHRPGLGGLRDQHVRHDPEAPREAHVRGDLVLHRHRASRSPCCTSSTRSRCPASLFKSYSIYAGVQDALVQWWYGHNAVAFFLTTPYLGLMYYFLPKAAEPPGVLLPALDHPLLGADLHLHLGRPAPPALHRAARLGAVARHGVLRHAHRALLGRHAQRPAHPARRLGQGPPGSRCSSSWSWPSPPTAWRRSRAPRWPSRASTPCRTTPTGPSPTCTSARWAGTASSPSACSTGCSRGSTTRSSGPPSSPTTTSGSACWA